MIYYEFSILTGRQILRELVFAREQWTEEIAREYSEELKFQAQPLISKSWTRLVIFNKYGMPTYEVNEILSDATEWTRQNNLKFSAYVVNDKIARKRLRDEFIEDGTAGFREVFLSDVEALDWLRLKGF